MSAATYSFKGTADMSQHNQQIEKAKQEITKYKNEVDKAQRSTQKLDGTKLTGAYNSQRQLQNTVKQTTNVLNGLQGNMMGALSKFGPYAAGAAAAIGVAFKATEGIMKQSDAWTDKFKRSMEGAAGAAGQLGYQIGKMDFSNLISNLQTAWNAAKNLYDAMDALGTFNTINDDTIKELEVQLEEARTRARKGEVGAAEDVKRIEKELEDAVNAAVPRINDAKDALLKSLTNWSLRGNSGWGTPEQLYNEVIGWKKKGDDEIDRTLKNYKRRLKDSRRGKSNVSPTTSDERYWEKEIHALELAQKLKDEDIKQVNELNQDLRNIRLKNTQTQRQDLRYINHIPGGGGGGKTDNTPDWEAGSIAEIDAKIKELQDRLKNEKFDIEVQTDINKQIEDLQNQKAMMGVQVAINGNTDLKNAFGDLLDGMLDASDVETFSKELLTLLDNYLASAPELHLPPFILPSAEMQASAKEAMAELEKIIDEEYTKMCKEIQARNQEMADSFSGLGSIFSSFGEMIGTETANWATALGDMLSIIGETISKLVALASANGVASAMELPFPANLAAVATVLAGIASAVSAIRGYSNEKYASGGIIEGSGSRIGDMHLARVNPGEMILNNRQQANLFRMMNNSAPAGGVKGSVTFHISGTDLVGVLDNQNRKTKRVR